MSRAARGSDGPSAPPSTTRCVAGSIRGRADDAQASLKGVKIAAHEPNGFGDRFARALVAFSRWSFDTATGYRHPTAEVIGKTVKALGKSSAADLTLDEKRSAGLVLTAGEWMTRILFLESIGTRASRRDVADARV